MRTATALSHFESDSARSRFVAAFAKRLYFRKKDQVFPLLVIADEIDLFAPQNPLGDQKTVLGSLALSQTWPYSRRTLDASLFQHVSPNQSATRDLSDLVQKGVLRSEGAGRSTRHELLDY